MRQLRVHQLPRIRFKALQTAPIESQTPFLWLRFSQFPAWCALQNEPHLAEKPFAICERGSVVSVSPAAIRAGVQVGMTNGTASARCGGLLVLPRDRTREMAIWRQIEREIWRLSPCFSSREIGLLECELAPQKLARWLRIWSQNGKWPVRAGSATDRATAFLAMQSAPNGITRAVKAGRESRFAGRAPLALLAGELEIATRRALEKNRRQTLGDLRRFSLEELENGLGSDGKTLYRFAQGALFADNLTPIPAREAPAKCVQLALFAPSFCQLNGREAYEISAQNFTRQPGVRSLS